MKKRLLITSLICVLVLMLCGCGSDSSDGSKPEVADDSKIEINQELCSDDVVTVSLAYLEDETVYFSVENKCDEDIRFDTLFFDVNGQLFSHEYEGEDVYSGKTQIIKLTIYDDNAEEVSIPVKVGDTVGGEFEYFSYDDEIKYCDRVRFDDYVISN